LKQKHKTAHALSGKQKNLEKIKGRENRRHRDRYRGREGGREAVCKGGKVRCKKRGACVRESKMIKDTVHAVSNRQHSRQK